MFNHMYVISMYSFRIRGILRHRYNYQKYWAVSCSCQPFCYTYWRFCSSWQLDFQNCSTETWRNNLHYGGKHGECCVLVCAQEQDFFSNTRKKKLDILWQVANWLTDSLTLWSSVFLEKVNSSLSNQQTLHILSNPKVHHFCNSVPHVPVLSQISLIHVLHPVSWISVLMLSTLMCLGVPKCVILFGFSEQKLCTTTFPMHTTYPMYLCLISQTMFCEEQRKWYYS